MKNSLFIPLEIKNRAHLNQKTQQNVFRKSQTVRAIKFLTGFISIVFLVLPLISWASFERDLYFGLKNDDNVITLQKFLQDQHMYNGPVNGNFFGLTKAAVKAFQESKDILATGSFGPKTRAQANLMFSQKSESSGENKSERIAKLIAQIQELQSQLRVLQTKQIKENTATSTAPIASVTPVSPPMPASSSPVTTTVATTTPVTTIPTAMIFSGESTTTFPVATVTPLKIGDVIIRNGTRDPLLFSQLVLDIQDSMNSPLNRGKSINFVLRNGSTTADDVTEKKAFTFNSSDPQKQDTLMHRNQINLSYPISFTPGETKSAGLWIENFDYVISGTLKFSFYDVQASRIVDKSGSFSFMLTK